MRHEGEIWVPAAVWSVGRVGMTMDGQGGSSRCSGKEIQRWWRGVRRRRREEVDGERKRERWERGGVGEER